MAKFYFLIEKIYKYFFRTIIGYLLKIIFKKKKIKFSKLGSDYGSWCFLNLDNLFNSIIISCGSGEDISFDIEFINKFNLKIILLDPTPRAIDYFELVKKSFGSKKKQGYTNDGKQKISSYDLTEITSQDLILIPKAIWIENLNQKKFFSPKNKKHVSYSFNDFSNDYRKDSDFIKVETITYDNVIRDNSINSLPLIKLDIEGSETSVIEDILEHRILPDQILVEFDELTTYELKAIYKYYRLHKKMLRKGYISVDVNNFSNQLYVKSSCLEKLH